MSFAGTQAECLERYAREYSAADAAELLSDATGKTPASVFGWLVGGRTPGGLTDIAIRTVLFMAGYAVDEYCELSNPSRELADMLALGVVTPEFVVEQLDYNDEHAIYRLTIKGTSPAGERAGKLRALVREHEEDLASARDVWEERIALMNPISRRLPSEDVSPVARQDTSDELPVEWEAAMAGFGLLGEVIQLVQHAQDKGEEYDMNEVWASVAQTLATISFRGEEERADCVGRILQALEELTT